MIKVVYVKLERKELKPMIENFIKHFLEDLNYSKEDIIAQLMSISHYLKKYDKEPVFNRYVLDKDQGYYNEDMNIDVMVNRDGWSIHMFPAPPEGERADFNKVLKKIELHDLDVGVLLWIFWDIAPYVLCTEIPPRKMTHEEKYDQAMKDFEFDPFKETIAKP